MCRQELLQFAPLEPSLKKLELLKLSMRQAYAHYELGQHTEALPLCDFVIRALQGLNFTENEELRCLAIEVLA
jgi:hypothetical protein